MFSDNWRNVSQRMLSVTWYLTLMPCPRWRKNGNSWRKIVTHYVRFSRRETVRLCCHVTCSGWYGTLIRSSKLISTRQQIFSHSRLLMVSRAVSQGAFVHFQGKQLFCFIFPPFWKGVHSERNEFAPLEANSYHTIKSWPYFRKSKLFT